MATSLQSNLRTYFDGDGFERWSAIYGGEAELSRVRRTIRAGHSEMLAQAEAWLAERLVDKSPASLLDAGCGTGLFSVPMAQRGHRVTAVDIAPRMVDATRQAAQRAGVIEQMEFHTGDIERVASNFERFDAVACLDVLVHYPRASFVELCTQLARLSNGPLLITYAPHSRLLATLHKISDFFPKGQRRTEIQMTPDAVVEQTLAEAGMRVRRTESVSRGFYHVKLLEAEKE